MRVRSALLVVAMGTAAVLGLSCSGGNKALPPNELTGQQQSVGSQAVSGNATVNFLPIQILHLLAIGSTSQSVVIPTTTSLPSPTGTHPAASAGGLDPHAQ